MSEPQSDFLPETQADLTRFVSENASGASRGLIPVGGGSALPVFNAANTVQVRLDKLNRVIDYPARDMTITVEAGIRMAELNRILAAEHQRLPIDVPQAEAATLGGVIATNWSGSRRFGCGTMRDYVIGISAIDATGQRFSAGGRVVKNVAGYDLCKLLVGSRGALAIITQVTLKLRPMPETSALVRLTFDSLASVNAALNRLLSSATRPVAMDVLSHSTRSLEFIVGFEGASQEVSWQAESLLQECRPFEPRASEILLGPEAANLWSRLRDFSIDPAAPATFKATLPASRVCDLLKRSHDAGISAQAHAGNGIVIGHLPKSVTTSLQAAELLRPLLELVRSSGGHLSLLRAPNDWSPLTTSADSWTGSLAWSQRLKRQLDSHNVLNPGVMAFGPA